MMLPQLTAFRLLSMVNFLSNLGFKSSQHEYLIKTLYWFLAASAIAAIKNSMGYFYVTLPANLQAFNQKHSMFISFVCFW